LHPWKLERIAKTLQTYLLEKEIETDWEFDVICVYLERTGKRAKIEYIENVIL